MRDFNYFNGVLRLLESPSTKILNNKFNVLQCKVQLPQSRNIYIATLSVWGKMSKDAIKNYTISDYVLVEGYISLRPSISSLNISKKIEISALKIHPYILSSDR